MAEPNRIRTRAQAATIADLAGCDLWDDGAGQCGVAVKGEESGGPYARTYNWSDVIGRPTAEFLRECRALTDARDATWRDKQANVRAMGGALRHRPR